MTARRDSTAITSDWYDVFRAVAAELEDPELLKLASLKNETVNAADTPVYAINIGMQASRQIAATRRTAAVVAAMLTQGGVSRPIITAEGEIE
jgi:hypothetical protein